MDFLSIAEVRKRAPEVREVAEAILSSRAVARDRSAQPWRFLAASVDKLFGDGGAEFRALRPADAAQLKFPVHRKLREYYARHAGQLGLELALVHEGQLHNFRVPAPDAYPRLAGYCLLVRDRASDLTLPEDGVDRLRDYSVRVVTEAAWAEFRAYQALPSMECRGLERWFVPAGPAQREIVARLEQRRRQGWALSGPFNPSTLHVESVRVRSLRADAASLLSRESWHLLWWSHRTRSYLYSFRETLWHDYELVQDERGWRVLARTLGRSRPH